MHNYDQTTEPTATSNGEFTDGDPILGIARTVLRSVWPNMIQRELLAVLADNHANNDQDGPLTPDANNDAQVVQAINNIATAIAEVAKNQAINAAANYTDRLPFGMRTGEIRQVPVDPGAYDTFTRGDFIFAELKGQDFAIDDYTDAWTFASTWYASTINWSTRSSTPGVFAFGPSIVSPTRFALPDMQGLFVRSTGGHAWNLGHKQFDMIRNITGKFGPIPLTDSEVMNTEGAISAVSNGAQSDTDGSGKKSNYLKFDASDSDDVNTGPENTPVNTAWPWIIRLT